LQETGGESAEIAGACDLVPSRVEQDAPAAIQYPAKPNCH
jgi:hypothetical protein